MTQHTPEFTLGIEEEYLLVDAESYDLVAAPKTLMDACKSDLEGKVSPEFLQCQIEVGSGVCQTIKEARDDLRHLRRTVAKHAASHGLAPIAASCATLLPIGSSNPTPTRNVTTFCERIWAAWRGVC